MEYCALKPVINEKIKTTSDIEYELIGIRMCVFSPYGIFACAEECIASPYVKRNVNFRLKREQAAALIMMALEFEWYDPPWKFGFYFTVLLALDSSISPGYP